MALYNILKVDVPLLFSAKVWGSFVQTNQAFFAAGSKVFGKCWHQHFWVPPACRSDTSRHFLIARSATWGGGWILFGGDFISTVGEKAQFHQGCFVFFNGGSGWQMNEMMQKAAGF